MVEERICEGGFGGVRILYILKAGFVGNRTRLTLEMSALLFIMAQSGKTTVDTRKNENYRQGGAVTVRFVIFVLEKVI